MKQILALQKLPSKQAVALDGNYPSYWSIICERHVEPSK